MNRHNAQLIAEELFHLMKGENPMPYERLMSSSEAADYLKMGEGHFSHIAVTLPRVRAGKRWLYPRNELNRVLTSK